MKLRSQFWFLIAILGLFLIGLGASSIAYSNLSLLKLLSFLAYVLIFSGLSIGLWSIKARETQAKWYLLLLFGLSEIIAGIFILAYEKPAVLTFTYLIGGLASLIGLIQVVSGIKKKGSAVMHYINGGISIILGVFIIFNPFSGESSLIMLIGLYSIILGMFILYYSFKAKRLGEASGAKAELKKDKESEI